MRATRSPGPRLNVLLYYPWLYLTSGAERTILEIARRSRHRVTVYTNEYQPESTFPELRDVDVRVLGRVPVERTLRGAATAAFRILLQRVDVSEFDVLLVVCEGLGDLMTLRHPKIPAVCLCLTPLRIVFDPVYRSAYLAKHGLLHRTAIGAASAVFRLVDRLAWRRYRRVFPISHEVRRRIVDGGLADPGRLRVMHPGIDLSAFAPSPPREKTFFVPGRIMWTKNLELAIDAFRLFLASAPDRDGWQLRIAGIVDRKSEPYLARLRERAAGEPAITFEIRPSDARMRESYRDCFATLFTAFNEDWGLVLIEAMASGKPAVAVNRGGPTEIVRHGQDGLLAPPDAPAFADAMLRLAFEPGLHAALAAEGPARAACFGWEPFIRDLDDAIEIELAPGAPANDAVSWKEARA
ncbi:MAG TPA: glycosyltransferase family 4 protein [Thermoanaerobaculia bacterium]|jgi:glycosyltransferase involved in cell wall biosynthesis